jgi:hypothetical protein
MGGSAVPEAGTNRAKARFMDGSRSTADGQAMAGFPNRRCIQDPSGSTNRMPRRHFRRSVGPRPFKGGGPTSFLAMAHSRAQARNCGGLIMKIHSIVAGIGALALLTSVAAAQGQLPGSAPPPAVTQSKVNLTQEQRYTIKEIIKDAKVDPAPASTPMSVGATVPGNVKLNPMPTAVAEKVPQIKSHLFFVKDGKIAIVDPKDREVVEAIE